MSKAQVNEREYTKLINEKMKEHDAYTDGMGVELNPTSSNRPSGYHTVGNADARTVAAWAEQQIKNEYELVVTK